MKKLKRKSHEIKIKYVLNKDVNDIKINEPKDADYYVRKVFPVDINHREAMVVIYVNRANNTIGYSVISIGGISGTTCDSRLIFQHALLCNVSGFIIVHNHPSGNLKASHSDIKLTNYIEKSAKLLNIEMLDHLIITENEHLSMRNELLIN